MEASRTLAVDLTGSPARNALSPPPSPQCSPVDPTADNPKRSRLSVGVDDDEDDDEDDDDCLTAVWDEKKKFRACTYSPVPVSQSTAIALPKIPPVSHCS